MHENPGGRARPPLAPSTDAHMAIDKTFLPIDVFIAMHSDIIYYTKYNHPDKNHYVLQENFTTELDSTIQLSLIFNCVSQASALAQSTIG